MSRLAVALAVALAGCSLVTDSFVSNDFSGDPFPTYVSTTTGAIVIGVEPAGFEPRVGVLDVLSPFTLVDPGVGDGDEFEPSISTATVTLRGRLATSPADDPAWLEIPRARLPDKNVVSLHPCAEEPCTVGPAGMQQPYRAIVGSEALAGDAVRLRLGDDQIFILADIGGTEQERGAECDAVFSEPYRGGGTLLVANTEVKFTGRRVTLQACLGFEPDPLLPQTERGADILAVLSTGIGVSLIAQSAYDRYRLVEPGAPGLPTLADETVYMPSGPVTGKRVTISKLALVAASGSAPRAPCRQVYAHHELASRRRCVDKITNAAGDQIDYDCPCTGGDTFCSVPAMVELDAPATIEMLVVPDSEPTLLALRTELRPDQPEVDAILGTQAIRTLELDIDYPHNRVLARCAGTGLGCTTRPALPDSDQLASVNSCIAGP